MSASSNDPQGGLPVKRLIVLIVVLVVAALGAGISSAHGLVNMDVDSPGFLNGNGSITITGEIECRPRQSVGVRGTLKQNTGESVVVEVGQCVPDGDFQVTVFPRGSGFFHTGAAQVTLILRAGDGHQITDVETIQIVND
jgi:hypothetical protein